MIVSRALCISAVLACDSALNLSSCVSPPPLWGGRRDCFSWYGLIAKPPVAIVVLRSALRSSPEKYLLVFFLLFFLLKLFCSSPRLVLFFSGSPSGSGEPECCFSQGGAIYPGVVYLPGDNQTPAPAPAPAPEKILNPSPLGGRRRYRQKGVSGPTRKSPEPEGRNLAPTPPRPKGVGGGRNQERKTNKRV